MLFSPKRAALAAALTLVVMLAAATQASAAPPTVNENGNILTVTTEGDDVILATDANGLITVNGTATALQAADATEITVNPGVGSGNDVVNAQGLTGIGNGVLTLNGGDGNDTLTGSPSNDTLNGDAGNDTLTGFKGGDTANGGDGDDLMVWNNGDGSDVNVGGDGIDTVQSNGADVVPNVATGDENYTYQGETAGTDGQVRFDRLPNAQNAGAFHIEFIAENLVVNSKGGVDSFEEVVGAVPLTNQTSITINAGDGDDTVKGGQGNDTLNGDAGNDTLTGFKGGDTANGGDGNDLMIWNNGDGSDENVGGDDTDTVESNGADVVPNVATGDENYTYQGVTAGTDGKVRFDRLPNAQNAGAFHIEFIAENLVVNSKGGVDNFEEVAGAVVLKEQTTITINAGEGNDTVKGSAGNDTLNGDDGNDTLTGAKGNDTASGGDGDDLMVWNNGDGSDVNVGGDNVDTVQSNGADVVPGVATGDENYTYQGETAGTDGQVRFDRLPNAQNLGAFHIEFTAENLVVNSKGGVDSFEEVAGAVVLKEQTTITINAGDGNDTVKGGQGSDTLNGDAGNDTLVGGKGFDTVKGGEGNDVIVWNNGDGSEVAAGEAGNDRLEVNGAPAGDEMKLAPGEFARSNLVPFTITLAGGRGEFEQVAVTGGDGNDTFTVSPGLAGLAVSADGGTGDDKLTGSEEADSFTGAAGNDVLLAGDGNDSVTGGAGSDVLDGQGGNDQLAARDLQADIVHGGAGTDSAVTDALTLDTVDGVEKLDATQAPPAPPAPPVRPPHEIALLPKLGRISVSANRQALFAKVPVSCPAAETDGCRVTLKVEAKAAHKVLGSKSVKLAPGGRATASIRLSGAARKLASHGRLAVRIRVATVDATGARASKTIAATLKVPRS